MFTLLNAVLFYTFDGHYAWILSSSIETSATMLGLNGGLTSDFLMVIPLGFLLLACKFRLVPSVRFELYQCIICKRAHFPLQYTVTFSDKVTFFYENGLIKTFTNHKVCSEKKKIKDKDKILFCLCRFSSHEFKPFRVFCIISMNLKFLIVIHLQTTAVNLIFFLLHTFKMIMKKKTCYQYF